MIRSIKFYTKMLLKFIKHDTVSKDDYGKAYDLVSKTYHLWLDQMSRYTDRIIRKDHQKDSKILDLACGSGYITKSLLDGDESLKLTSVDISSDMLSSMDEMTNVTAVQSDGIEFLKADKTIYDAIYCGWALPYFDHDELINSVHKHLTHEGTVSVISNSKGTLSGIENIFLNVMKHHQKEIHRPMEIKFNLPNGKNGLTKWFEKHGFEPMVVEEDEVVFSFDTPEELHEWLSQTGAIAGTKEIFKDYNNVKKHVIDEIKRKKCQDGQYSINHKFVYGIFRKAGKI